MRYTAPFPRVFSLEHCFLAFLQRPLSRSHRHIGFKNTWGFLCFFANGHSLLEQLPALSPKVNDNAIEVKLTRLPQNNMSDMQPLPEIPNNNSTSTTDDTSSSPPKQPTTATRGRSSSCSRSKRQPSASKASYARVSRLVSTVVCLMLHHLSSVSLDHFDPNRPSQWLALGKQSPVRPPAALFAFSQRLIANSKLSLPVILVSLKYVERYLVNKRRRNSETQVSEESDPVRIYMQLENPEQHPFGGRTSEYGVLLAALAAANKFLDDSRYSNRWWAKVAEMRLGQVNLIEMEFLNGISFDLYIQEKEYVDWVNAMQKLARWLEEQAVAPGNSVETPIVSTRPSPASIPQIVTSTSHNPTPGTPLIPPEAKPPSIISPVPSPMLALPSLPIGVSWQSFSSVPMISPVHSSPSSSPAHNLPFLPPPNMSSTSSPFEGAASVQSLNSSPQISGLGTLVASQANLVRSGAVRKKRADPLLGVRHPHHPSRLQPYRMQHPQQSDHNHYPQQPLSMHDPSHRSSMCSISSNASMSSMSSTSTTSTFEAFLHQQSVLERMLEGGADGDSASMGTPSHWSVGTASSFGSLSSGAPESISLPRWYKPGEPMVERDKEAEGGGKGFSLPRWFRVEDGSTVPAEPDANNVNSQKTTMMDVDI